MYKNKKFIGVIPARGGSKGIPKKNIIEVNSKPLIAYTIEEAVKSRYLDYIVVSTDDEEIAAISQSYGASVPFLRPIALSSDTSKSIDALIHALQQIDEKFDYVVLLQPTQPMRRTFHIDEAIAQIVNQEQSSLVSLSLVREHPILMRTIDKNGTLLNVLPISSTARRQDFPDFYKVNGAIYINQINDKFDRNVSLNDNVSPYIMEPFYDVDIDEIEDLEVFKYRLELLNSMDKKST